MSPHLSFDIQVQIIKLLPVKSLIQFRSVCKAWKSLIGSSQFIAGYNFHHDQSEHLLVTYAVEGREEPEVKYVCFVDDDTFPQQKFNLTVPPLVQATTIIGSSHGLFCLTSYFQGPEDSSTKEMAILWNPTIRKSIAVVVPNVVHRPFNTIVGFGVCPDTKDPKLVNFTYIDDYTKMEGISSIPFQVMVFTLSSGEWTTSSSNLPRKSIQFGSSYQTVMGQFIYWVACEQIAFNGQFRKFRKHNLIISFDLSTNDFREVHLPDSLCESNLFISRRRESLVLLEYNRNMTTDKQVCTVWLMDHGDLKAFTKLFTINAPNASVEWTLGFRMSGEPIIEMQHDVNMDDSTSALAVYEPCLEDVKDLGICGYNFSFHGSSYTESLLLLDHDDGRILRC